MLRSGEERLNFRFLFLFFVALSSAATAAAQQGSAASQASPATTPNSMSLPALSATQLKQALSSPDFTPLVAQAILQQLTEGMESHNLDKAKSVFDGNSFSADFFDRMAAAFDYFESFSVYYHLQSAQLQNGVAEVATDFQMEGDPQQENAAPQRRETDLRFTLARVSTRDGMQWRIVQLAPADFLFRY